jgi:hypothetical protein
VNTNATSTLSAGPVRTAIPVNIRIGPDGTLYFHDITLEMLPVALAMCPDNEDLKRRVAAAEHFAKAST